MDKTSAIKHIRNNLPQCAASNGYKVKYVGQMVHTKFHGLQTDSQLNWKNHINEISTCAYNAQVLISLILVYVCTHFLMQRRLQWPAVSLSNDRHLNSLEQRKDSSETAPLHQEISTEP
jgi:hypothetical protein